MRCRLMNKEKHINTNKQKRIYMRDIIPRKQQTLRGELKKEEKMRAGSHMSKKSSTFATSNDN